MTVRQLSISADLTIDIGDHQVKVRGAESSIDVEVASVAIAFKMMRDLGNIGLLRRRIARLSLALSSVGLTVIVRTPHRRILTVGQNGNSWLLRRFGVPNARLHIS